MSEELLEGELQQEPTPTDTLQDTEPVQDTDNQDMPYWQQHENHKKGFWKTEKDVIDGYDYYDKKFKPYETVLSQRGIKDHNGLTELFKKHDEYTDPNSEINQTYNSINALFNDEKYGPEVKGFFEQLAEKKELERWGTKLPPEVKQRLDRIDQLEAKQQETEHRRQTQEFETQLDGKVSEISKFCESYGLGLDEKGFLKHCLEKKIGIDRMVSEFKSMHLDDVISNVQNKSAASVTKNLEKNSKSAVPSGNKVPSTVKSSPTDSNSLRKAMQAVFK